LIASELFTEVHLSITAKRLGLAPLETKGVNCGVSLFLRPQWFQWKYRGLFDARVGFSFT
jgi:hypothetical protein